MIAAENTASRKFGPIPYVSAAIRKVPAGWWPLLAFVLLFCVGGLINASLFTMQSLWNTLAFGMLLVIASAGQTIVIIQGGIDLSIPNLMTVSALGYLSFASYLGATGAMVAALVVGVLLGAINGLGIVKLRISPIVMTIAMNAMLLGVVLLRFTVSQNKNTPDLLLSISSMTFDVGGAKVAAIVPVGAALVLLFQLLLSKSGFGRMIFLVGSSPSMANLVGIPVDIVRVGAYALSGMMSAYAGLSTAGFFQEAATGMGDQYLLGSIAAVVVGGTSIVGGRGSMIGTMGGALVLGQIATLLSIGNLGVSIQQIAYGLLILFVVSVYGRDAER